MDSIENQCFHCDSWDLNALSDLQSSGSSPQIQFHWAPRPLFLDPSLDEKQQLAASPTGKHVTMLLCCPVIAGCRFPGASLPLTNMVSPWGGLVCTPCRSDIQTFLLPSI